MMRKRSASTAPGVKPRPSAGVETWPTEGETSRRASEGSAVGDEGELAGAPHDEQNRAASGTSAAQLGQRDIAADCIPRYGESGFLPAQSSSLRYQQR
jgi:hypothetical protein